MVDKAVVKVVQNYLRLLRAQGLPVHSGVIFGSQATGATHPWSDIDLIVISPRFDGVRRREDIDLLWRMTVRTDSRIEPVPVGERQWEEDSSSPIIEIARREGQRVAIGRD